MSNEKPIHKEIEDVIFTPGKRSIKLKIFLGCIVLIAIGAASLYYFYIYRNPESNYSFLKNTSTPKAELPTDKIEDYTIDKDEKYEFQTIKTFTNNTCGLQTGQEIYTDWFTIKGQLWRIKLSSNRLVDNTITNTRVWYTTSSIPIEDNNFNNYIEIGDGRPPGETGTKKGTYDIEGVGTFRLRIMCWNTNYTIEVQDSI